MFAVGCPAGEEDDHVVGSELDFFVAIAAGAPELAVGVGPGDPLAVAGVADAHGGTEESFFGDELAGGVEVLELGAGVDAEEEDAIAGAGSDRRAELQRAVGETGGIRRGCAGEAPEIGVSAATGLEDEVAAVGGPDAAALGGGLTEVGKQPARCVIGGGELPEGGGVGERVDDGEAKELAVRGPAQPEGAAGKRGVELRRAAGDDGEIEVIAVGVEDAAVVGHPGGVVREDVADAECGAADGGDGPEGLFGFGGEVIAEQEAGAVGGDVAECGAGDFGGNGERGDGAVGE